MRNKKHVQIRQGVNNLLVLLYNKNQSCYCHCVCHYKGNNTWEHTAKPIKIQLRHIASSLPSHVVNLLLSHYSYLCTCVHCIKSPPLLAPSQIFQHQISLSVPRIPGVAIQGDLGEGEQNRGNFTLSIHLQYEGLIGKQEMSYERQARMLMVPVAISLHIEIK